jgi:hypothetical protein
MTLSQMNGIKTLLAAVVNGVALPGFVAFTVA